MFLSEEEYEELRVFAYLRVFRAVYPHATKEQLARAVARNSGCSYELALGWVETGLQILQEVDD